MFVVTGIRRDRGYRTSVVWDAGAVTSEEVSLAEAVEDAALAAEGVQVGPPSGPFTDRDHLADPFSALMFMLAEFEPKTTTIAGADAPVRPAIPYGAIG